VVNQRLAVRLLEKRGHQVTLAKDGHEAVRASAAEHFDLILMDLQMPEMGGIEATAAIRAREISTGGHVPIVAMTAHAMSGDSERCLEGGMDGYLSKPIKPHLLYSTIEGLATSYLEDSRMLLPGVEAARQQEEDEQPQLEPVNTAK
jgi:CheY-like chemotaxis protein